MEITTQRSPSAAHGLGFEALAMVLVIVLITASAWGSLWFGPGFDEGMRNLFSGTRPPPPTLTQKFAEAWQWILAAAALGAVACVLLRSRWMRLASIIWCGSIVILAAATSIQRGVTPVAVLVMLSAIATTIGTEILRARAV